MVGSKIGFVVVTTGTMQQNQHTSFAIQQLFCFFLQSSIVANLKDQVINPIDKLINKNETIKLLSPFWDKYRHMHFQNL